MRAFALNLTLLRAGLFQRAAHIANLGHLAVIDPLDRYHLLSTIMIRSTALLLALAIGVKLSSPGPVIFRQRRNGLDGSEIVVYKFRTMRVDANVAKKGVGVTCFDGYAALNIEAIAAHVKKIVPHARIGPSTMCPVAACPASKSIGTWKPRLSR